MKRNLLLIIFILSGISIYAQKTFEMAGVVYDETGETLPGATIFLKNEVGVGTSSDADGNFKLKASRGDMIVFSYIGYDEVEYLVTEERNDLKINFTTSSVVLEEYVAVGLGSVQRKISSVAAVTSLDVSELQSPTTSVANLLGGKVAGVISMQTSGEPGQNISEFWVRGIGTFGASSGALVLIDGLEGNINSIDPADIESFSVLKDASATAVYGVRGANGVVLITTKRGQEGKLNITVRTNFSLSQLRRVPEYLGAYDYALLANEAMEVRGERPLYRPMEMAIIKDNLDPDMYPDVSWQDEVLRNTSFKQSYYVSAKGGGSIAKYFLSLGGNSETAAYKFDKKSPYASNVGYNTYNYRTNLDINLTKSTTVYFGADGHLSINNQPGTANTDYIWMAQSQLNPLYIPTIYSNGMYPAGGADADSSPYVMINQTGKRANENYKGKVTIALNQDLSSILDGLNIRAQGAYDTHNYFYERRFIQPALYMALERRTDGSLVMREMVKPSPASYNKSTNQYRKYHFESTLNYEKIFGEDHRASGLVYYYLSDEKYTEESTNNMTAIPVRYQGVSSRFTYSFKDTYMVDLNFGITGSENFQPGRQYGFFPSAAIGWVPSSYQWVKDNMSWVSMFKIRASHGSVGNDRLAGSTRFPYMTKARLSNGSVYESISDVEILDESRVGADNLEWESSYKTDIGIEGSFFDESLSFVVDFFNDQRDGIFQPRAQVPDYVGLTNMPYGNVGRMKSFGSDGNISYSHKINDKMRFTIRGNYTFSDTKVQNWEQAYLEYPYLFYTGFPNNVHRGYQSIGLFKDEDDIKQSPIQTFGTYMPGDIKYKDVNGDGKIDATDMVPLSRSTYPMLMYGFGGEISYKNLRVGVLLKGTGRTDFYSVGQNVRHNNLSYSNGMGYVPFFGGVSGNVLKMANDPKNRWIPMEYAIANGIDPALAENPNATFPRLQYGRNNNNSQKSDFWQGDGRSLRLQEITVNYNLKTAGMRKLGIASVDIQLIGTNLHVWSKEKIFDPEQARYNGRVYPIPSVYSLQLYINL